jgi:pyruvate formate lyase activating enzyme
MAIEMSGRVMSVDEIMEAIEKERVFFDHSGGGVTFSGGEPLVHLPVLKKLLDECGRRHIHRAVDTAGHVSTVALLEAAAGTDLFLYDLKMMDSDLHRKWTGVPNEKILHNLSVLAETGADIIIRIPLMGGINDTEENIEKTAQFVARLAGKKKDVNILPYHRIAQNKYMKLGRSESFGMFEEPGKETLERVIQQFVKHGIKATIGG